MSAKLRTVWWANEFDISLRQLRLSQPQLARIDEFIEGAIDILSREPRFGTRLDRNGVVWYLPIADVPTLPRLWLYYAYDHADDNNVVLLEIHRA